MTVPAGELAVHDQAADPSLEPDARKQIAGRSPTRIAFDRLKRDPIAVVCFLVVVLFILIAIFADQVQALFGVSTETVRASDVIDPVTRLPLEGPPNGSFDPDHPFGLAPGNGTDNLAVWIEGCRTSLYLATVAAVLSTIIGVTLGLLAGFVGGILDTIISFVTDLFLTLPFLVMALAISPILNDRFGDDTENLKFATFYSLVAILVFFGWMGVTRLVRGEVLSLREREFVKAARVIGVPTHRILLREMLPNLIAPIIISFSLGLPAYIAARGRSVLPRHRRVRARVLGTDHRRGHPVVGAIPALPARARPGHRHSRRRAQPARRRPPRRVRSQDETLIAATRTSVERMLRPTQQREAGYMKRTNALVAGLSAATLALTLAACGGGDDDGDSGATTPSRRAPAAPAARTPTPSDRLPRSTAPRRAASSRCWHRTPTTVRPASTRPPCGR